MKKFIVSMIAVFTLSVVVTTAASAATQQSNADVYLGSYSMSYGAMITSSSCKATLSSMTLYVSNTAGGGSIKVQEKVNGVWKDKGTAKTVSGSGKYTKTFTPVKNREYRLKITSSKTLTTMKGTAHCY